MGVPECAYAIPAEDFFSAVTRAPVTDPDEPLARPTLLPGPAIEHGRIVMELDRLPADRRIALAGNSPQGLSIAANDQRSFGEFARTAS